MPARVRKPFMQEPAGYSVDYGDFDLRPMSASARSLLESAEVGADRLLRCASAWYCWLRTLLVADLSAPTVIAGAGLDHIGRAPQRRAQRDLCRLRAGPGRPRSPWTIGVPDRRSPLVRPPRFLPDARGEDRAVMIAEGGAILASYSWIRSAARASPSKAPSSYLRTQTRIRLRVTSCRFAKP